MTGPLIIDIVTRAAWWRDTPDTLEAAARHAAQTAWRKAGCGAREAEVSIVLGGDALIRRLNGDYRGQDRATNVLSFPADGAAGPDTAPRLLGDIVLAYETIAREAGDQGKSLCDHVSHLCVHGLLHLLGHDHQSDGDAEAMEALETVILADLGIADPFAARSATVEQGA